MLTELQTTRDTMNQAAAEADRPQFAAEADRLEELFPLGNCPDVPTEVREAEQFVKPVPESARIYSARRAMSHFQLLQFSYT